MLTIYTTWANTAWYTSTWTRWLNIMNLSTVTIHTKFSALRKTLTILLRQGVIFLPSVPNRKVSNYHSFGLRCDRMLILNVVIWDADFKFQKKKSINLSWLGIRTDFLTMSKMVQITLLPFCTMHLCEAIYSVSMIIKSKYQPALKNI